MEVKETFGLFLMGSSEWDIIVKVQGDDVAVPLISRPFDGELAVWDSELINGSTHHIIL